MTATVQTHPLISIRPDATVQEAAQLVNDCSIATIGPDESLFRAAQLLDRHGIKRLPIVDEEGYLLGLVSRGDLVRAMTFGEENFEAVGSLIRGA